MSIFGLKMITFSSKYPLFLFFWLFPFYLKVFGAKNEKVIVSFLLLACLMCHAVDGFTVFRQLILFRFL